MKTLVIFITLFAFALPAVAGPNWTAIEGARKEKHEQKQEQVKQQSKHGIAMQKLQAACDKVKDNKDLADACKAIMEADKDAFESK